MPTVWLSSLKRSLHCKSEPSDVHDPKSRKQLNSILTRKAGGGRSGCSRSIANLKDVIHGSKRHMERPPSCSPRSIGSSEFLNPITHEVILSNSRCELKITGFGNYKGASDGVSDSGGSGSPFVGTLRPGTPGPGGHPTMHYFNPSFRNNSSAPSAAAPPPVKKSPLLPTDREDGNGSSTITCHKCGEHFTKFEAAENHHLSKHAVTELVEGDSSRKIVEIICKTSWLKSESHCGRIERVLKVHNMQKTLARFEEYREMVKMRASKLQKKHPRCIADGNELLRIIRNGFSAKKELKGVGVFTTSTSGRAFECIEVLEEDACVRKALLVCRVIAGRVHRPVEKIQEFAGQTGFDSLAGKVGLYSNIEELYLLNPRALLPCFVVICKS
ncbi:hypothetical protein LINPERPRIM_LOCUS5565 [Linum perenne]